MEFRNLKDIKEVSKAYTEGIYTAYAEKTKASKEKEVKKRRNF